MSKFLLLVVVLSFAFFELACAQGTQCELCGKRKPSTHAVKYLLYGTHQLCNECESDLDDAIAAGIALEILDRLLE